MLLQCHEASRKCAILEDPGGGGGVKSSTEVETLPQQRRVKTKVVGERGRREKQEASYGGSSMLAARAEAGSQIKALMESMGEQMLYI